MLEPIQFKEFVIFEYRRRTTNSLSYVNFANWEEKSEIYKRIFNVAKIKVVGRLKVGHYFAAKRIEGNGIIYFEIDEAATQGIQRYCPETFLRRRTTALRRRFARSSRKKLP